jgi:hypothetical protein
VFMKRLESVRRGGQTFGFAARAAAAPPGLAVLAVVPEVRADLVQAVSQAGADAVALSATWAAVQDGEALKTAVEAAGGKPVGLMLASSDQGPEPGSDWWGRSGLDFLVVDAGHPAALLAMEGAKLVSLPRDFDPMQARALDGLPVDGFVVASHHDGRPRLSIGDVARYRLLASGTGKPMLVVLGEVSDPGELKAANQAGVDGVVLLPAALSDDVAAASDVVSHLRDAVTRLGPRRSGKDRSNRATALLPRVSSGASEEQEEEGQ